MKLVAAIVLSLSFAVSASAQTQAAGQDVPSIVVSGEGMVAVAPDQAWVRIGAENRSKISQEAQQRNAEAMTAVQKKLASLGIPKDAIKTITIDLQLEFDYDKGRQTPRGYVARNTIEVRVDDLAKLGEVLDAAVGSGATNLHGLRFDVKNRESLEQTALQNAVKNAMGKAQAVAQGAGRAIERVLRIEEASIGYPPPQPMFERAMTMQKADATTPVSAGEIEIRAQVRLTAAIK